MRAGGRSRPGQGSNLGHSAPGLRWYVLGNRVSERQWLDVLGVLKVQGDSIDREYLTRWARLLDLDELLEEALSQAFDTE